MTATGWGNGINGDFKLNYGGVDYGYNQRVSLGKLLSQNGQTADVHTSYNTDTTLWQIYKKDNEGDNSTHNLGGFTWDSANNRWNSHQ